MTRWSTPESNEHMKKRQLLTPETPQRYTEKQAQPRAGLAVTTTQDSNVHIEHALHHGEKTEEGLEPHASSPL